MNAAFDLPDRVRGVDQDVDQDLAQPPGSDDEFRQARRVVALDDHLRRQFPADEPQDLIEEIGDLDHLLLLTTLVCARENSEVTNDVGDGRRGAMHFLE
jgi:hypothetical protein